MVVSNICFHLQPYLGTSKIGEDFQFDSYFSDGLKPPPSNVDGDVFVCSSLQNLRLKQLMYMMYSPAEPAEVE